MAIDSAEPITQEILAAAESLRPLLEPRSVALIGASRSEKKIGGAILSNLVAGYAGALYVVNPEVSEVRGIKCYPSISAIGELIDLAVIATPAHTVPTIVEECGRAGIKGVVIISAGFAEISAPQGRELQDRVTSIAKSFGMRIIGPNCLGVLNTDPALNFNATFAPISPPAGNVGFLSQSGALAIAALDYARAHNIGLSSFVSVGNKADVSSNDMLAYWACDKRTKVIALYLESFGNPRNFVRIAPEVSRTTPIVAVKSGRSVAGKRAASSHSASLASVESAVDAVFSQTGVIRTDTLEQLYDVINLLATQPEPGGPRVGVITNAGGPGILAVDALEGEGLKVPELSERVISKLKTFLPPHASLTNPVDMIASAGPEHFLKSISALGTSGEVDCLLVIYVPPMVSDPESIARAIAEGAAAIPNELPIATIFLSSKGAPPVLSNGPRGPIPSYSFPENAAHALAASYRHKRWKEKRRGERIVLEEDKARSIREIVLGSPSSGP
ncbi:MAG: CoA-binding protein, partial [Deltaproteobacteria bacterium]|nr:CoA-binding protein [Deltaproteobacteria bacterium]